MRGVWAATALALMVVAGCQPKAADKGGAEAVDQARIVAADSEPQNWLSHGRTYSEQRFSPLKSIDASNVAKLGLAWSYETAAPRGAEATPIVIDGVMYVTSAWSIVYALDAKTGKQLWVYDPKVPHAVGANACCDVVNRGVALWKGKVYVGALDGRLIALNAKDGTVVWSKATTDPNKAYTITGAPRIAKGLVFIGNGGAEYDVRGYISAYDAETGDLKWRFYTVPGDPAKGPDHAASDPQMAMAAKTWNTKNWSIGGGGTVWDSIVYDPELNQLYFGVGNGLPWNENIRSPSGGDNLFHASIVAVNPDTGAYLWHYQETPGDSWDFDANQQITLATMKIDGQDRKILMQASKNGFFYVIDRSDGKLISAKNVVPMAKETGKPKGLPISWAYGVDLKTGRPMENEAARYHKTTALVTPAPYGAHNWHPMSFDPQTGLVYVPIQEMLQDFTTDPKFTERPGRWNIGVAFAPLPEDQKTRAGMIGLMKGYLIAWDPVAQKEVWRVAHAGPWNGGALSTAGGLVFEGTVDGKFEAYDAKLGKTLWSYDNQAATLSGPMTYAVDGQQYVAVMSGYGTAFFLAAGAAAPKMGQPLNGRVVVYKLGGNAKLPDMHLTTVETPEPPTIKVKASVLDRGGVLYTNFCAVCHGLGAIGGGVIPDLRKSPVLQDAAAFRATIGGARADLGMPNFDKWIAPNDRDAIRAYVAHEARPLYEAEQAAKKAGVKGGG